MRPDTSDLPLLLGAGGALLAGGGIACLRLVLTPDDPDSSPPFAEQHPVNDPVVQALHTELRRWVEVTAAGTAAMAAALWWAMSSRRRTPNQPAIDALRGSPLRDVRQD